MKRYLEFTCMALGVPWVHWTLLWFALLVILVLCGCSDEGAWTYKKDGTYGPWWHDDKIDAQYAHPSANAPESLKPFYDPGLTQALNR